MNAVRQNPNGIFIVVSRVFRPHAAIRCIVDVMGARVGLCVAMDDRVRMMRVRFVGVDRGSDPRKNQTRNEQSGAAGAIPRPHRADYVCDETPGQGQRENTERRVARCPDR